MYIISAKHKYDFEDEYNWKYAAIDNGSFGTGYPCWSSYDGDAKHFETIKDAKEWWRKNSCYLLKNQYDLVLLDTVTIKKKIYKTVEKLSCL